MNLSLPSSSTISSATASSNNPSASTSWFSGIVRGRTDRSGSVKMFSSFGAGKLAGPIKGKNQFHGVLFKYGSKAVQVAFKTGDYKQQVIFIGGLTDGFLATEYLEPLAIALDKEKCSLVQVLLSSSYTGYGTSNLQQRAKQLIQAQIHPEFAVVILQLLRRMVQRTMEWAARGTHLGGVPRKAVIMAVGAVSKAVASILNSTNVHNADTLLRFIRSRPPGVPLITISNHMSTLDDPVMWGFKGFPTMDAKQARWVLAAEDICFKNKFLSYIFRLGKCIPITRGGGIYQEHMNEALERLGDGEWLHTFPEGKVSQVDAPIRRLKWGTASLIDRAPITPIVLPIIHQGLQEVMPENYFLGRRPPFPLCNKKINVVVGEPIQFNLAEMRQMAISNSRDLALPTVGWPSTSYGLDEAAQRCLYSTISERIHTVMETLRSFSKMFLKN